MVASIPFQFPVPIKKNSCKVKKADQKTGLSLFFALVGFFDGREAIAFLGVRQAWPLFAMSALARAGR